MSPNRYEASAARRLRHRLPSINPWPHWLHNLVRLALLLGILALCAHALAGTRDATLTWSAVTQNADGTPATITGYRIWRSYSSAAKTFTAIALVDGATLSYFDAHPPAQVNYYRVSAIGLINGQAVEGDPSNVVSKRIHLPAPAGGVVVPPPKGGVVLPPKQ